MISSILILTVSMAFRIVDMEQITQALDFCNGEDQQLFLGDFNGDKRSDLLCRQKTDGQKLFLNAKTDSVGYDSNSSWEFAKWWCSGKTQDIHLGDYNGDGRDDLLCHDTTNGYAWISLADASGNFTGTSWDAKLGFCWHSPGRVHIADFNGDGRTDLLCHDTSSGKVWISLAKEGGKFEKQASWEKDMGWCNSASNKLLVGDFNGDGKADMLCTDTATGYKKIALANSNGTFTGTSWEKQVGWCSGSQTLRLGDLNGDGRTDMTCNDAATGWKRINYAKADGSFELNFGTNHRWCINSIFEVGNFDGNNKDDWICKDASNIFIWTF